MKLYLSAFFGACTVLPAAGLAQSVAVPAVAPAQAVVVGGPAQNVLRTGTDVSLKLKEPLTTEGKKLRVGYRFQMEVAEPVMVNGQVVVPIGSPALGEITEVRNKGMWGKSGHLTASVLYLTANGRQIRLNGTFDDKGVTGTGAVVGAVLLVPVVGFFTTGTSARIPAGAPIKAFIGEDVPLTFVATQAAPMAVPSVPSSVAPPAVASSPATVATASVPVAATTTTTAK